MITNLRGPWLRVNSYDWRKVSFSRTVREGEEVVEYLDVERFDEYKPGLATYKPGLRLDL